MNSFYQQQPDPGMVKELFRRFYQQNKFLVFLMLGITVALIALGEGWHSLFIVSILYFSGVLFKQYLGLNKLIYTLLYGALGGALLYAGLFHQQFDTTHLLVGAIDSAIFAVLAAVATYAPNFELTFFMRWRVKLKYLAIAFSLLALISITETYNYRFVMLAGLLYGFLSIYLRNRNPYRQKTSFQWNKLWQNKKGPYVNKRKHKQKTRAKQEQNQTQRETDEEYNRRKKQEQAEIDKILDKVKLKGYESLSAQEKQKLFEQKR